VCGADPVGLGLRTDIKSAHVARGGRRQAQHGGKKVGTSALREVRPLTAQEITSKK